MKLWFGKHEGKDLVDVPLPYLRWLEERSDLDPKLRKELNFEIERRTGDRPGMGKTVRKADNA